MKQSIRLSSILILGVFMSAIAFTSCSNNQNKLKEETKNFTEMVNEDIDSTVSPRQDFYDYSVGKWVKNNPIPPDQSIWASFVILYENTNKQVKGIVESAAKEKGPKGSIAQKVGDFYSTGMDSAKAEQLGISPLKSEFKRIKNVNSKDDLVKEIAHQHVYTSSPLFSFGATPDFKNSDMMIAGLSQGGLGLPDRDYYVKDDPRSKQVRAKYLQHMTNMFILLGDKKEAAKKHAKTVMKIETRFAKHSRTRVERRDPQKNYNKMDINGLTKLAPNFDWKLFFSTVGWNNLGEINVGQPEFFVEESKMIDEIPINDWKQYLRWNLIRRTAGYLSSDFVNENFDFWGKFLSGTKEMRPRWKRVLSATNGALGKAIGQLYVKKYFPPEAKKRAYNIVQTLLASMKESIESNTWMSDSTKQQAVIKLKAFGVKIGYPDKWKDYSKLEIKDDSYVQNVMRSNEFDVKRDLAKIGKPVDRTEWHMNPQTVNAYYSPLNNEIVFPAAILQPPFYNVIADDATNYGAMGAVIGHEITHGFDDQGRQFDAKGNLRDWWTKTDAEKYKKRAQRIIDQFNAYTPIDDDHINGELTQGENIADLGGLTISYNAYKKTDEFKSGKKIDIFTPTQRYYLSWANVWKGNVREQLAKLRLKTDPHSPGKYRVNGPLSNLPPFYKAFNVNPGDKMWRADSVRVKIW
ncbi:neutral endopeptidase [bacterium BMS3Abin04]|nr:neutral endopeptidase [bacterium BMS3Abin04]